MSAGGSGGRWSDAQKKLFWERIEGMIGGMVTDLLTAVGVGWMTGAPWLAERIGQLLKWLPGPLS